MNLKSYIQFSTLSFPSPIGELHFSIMTGGTMGVEFVIFPSPIGELHFSIFSLNSTKLFPQKVSVPYRGATFLNPTELQWYVHSYIVSVPYRGATFLNTDKIFLTLQAHTFPSPIGDLHFSMLLLYLDVEHIVSVPYRGATFLNQSKSPIIKSLGKVSVPYRGATFLNKSISTYARKLHAVSVPYRGATFLN